MQGIKETMYSLVKQKPEKGLWLTESPVPRPGPGDVLIRIHKTAICGTDVHIYNWDEWSQKTIPVPMITGHEYVGEVAAVGEGVRGFEPGELVSGEGHIVCGVCRNCLAGRKHLCPDTKGVGVNRPGAFAGYLCIPAQNVWKCPSGISEEVYACFDPLGNAVHTALSFDVSGEDVLITGAGPIGCMAAAICRHTGARNVVVTDLNEYRLNLAKTLGATRTVNVTEEKLTDVMKELNMREGFDVGYEMSGSGPAFAGMVDVMRCGGSIALLGIQKPGTTIDWDKVVFHGLKIKGIYGRETFETWYKMTAMLQSGLDITKVITHRFDFRDFEQGFEAMNSGMSGKVVLDWTTV